MYLKFENLEEFYEVLIFDFNIYTRYEELTDIEQRNNATKEITKEELATIKDHWKIFKRLFPETYKRLTPFFEKKGILYGFDVKVDNDDIDEWYDAEKWQYIKDFE